MSTYRFVDFSDELSEAMATQEKGTQKGGEATLCLNRMTSTSSSNPPPTPGTYKVRLLDVLITLYRHPMTMRQLYIVPKVLQHILVQQFRDATPEVDATKQFGIVGHFR